MQATVAVGTTLSRKYNTRICFVKVHPQFAVREMQSVDVKVVDAIALASYNGVQRGETMGKSKEPRPVKWIASVFSADEMLLAEASDALASRLGHIDYQSELLPFDHTQYYAREFGEGLLRQILSFTELAPPQRLAEVKGMTNELEMTWAVGQRRRVNLDPGYLSLSKMVLATTKDYSHRIYLGQGIYAEVTLHYRHGAFHPWEWTYPDYASPRYLDIFGHIRDIYVAQLRTILD